MLILLKEKKKDKKKINELVNEVCDFANKEARAHAEERARLLGNNDSLEIKLWQTKKGKDELRLQNKRIQEKAQALRESNSAMERTITDLNAQLEQERGANRTLRSTISNIRIQLTATQIIPSTQPVNSSTFVANLSPRENSLSVNEICDFANKEARAHAEERARLLGNNNSLEVDLWQTKKDKDELRLQNKRIQEKAQALRESNSAMERTITDLNAQLEQERGANRTLRSTISNMGTQLTAAQIIPATQPVNSSTFVVNLSQPKENSFSTIKKYIPNPFNYYGLLGTSALFSSIVVLNGLGFIKFQYKNLGAIAAVGYCSSLLGLGISKGLTKSINKKIGGLSESEPEVTLYWMFSAIFGTGIGFVANTHLGKVDITSKADTYPKIGAALLFGTGFVSSAAVHRAYQKWYGGSK